MRLLGPLAVIVACGGCVELNPVFIEEDSEGSGEAASDDTDDPSQALCDDDPFEPNNLSVPSLISFGSLDAALGDESDLDLYRADLVSDAAVEVVAQIDRSDLKVCVFASCGDGSPAMITKCTGDPDTGGNNENGCCSPGGVSIEPVCGTEYNATVFARVEAAPNGCAPYRLDFNALTL